MQRTKAGFCNEKGTATNKSIIFATKREPQRTKALKLNYAKANYNAKVRKILKVLCSQLIDEPNCNKAFSVGFIYPLGKLLGLQPAVVELSTLF
ncbi:hypothetical protein L0337_24490 [candidate division KSB1 bacterium]|nr:hypothetical protein [candidate division KSB1 bacterium]